MHRKAPYGWYLTAFELPYIYPPAGTGKRTIQTTVAAGIIWVDKTSTPAILSTLVMGALRVDILTLFPRMFEGVFNESILRRAKEKGKVDYHVHDIRDHTRDKHRSVDEPPYGGGPGMVLRPEPVVRAVEAIPGYQQARRILLTPVGQRFDQARAKTLARIEHLILICGHYEGIDERVRWILEPEEVSVGDFILTGGELAAMVVVDAVTRLLPGVLGCEDSTMCESFSEGRLEYPQFTRPASYRGHDVPDVLLSGHHQKIADWRDKMSAERTWTRRPDLLEGTHDADHQRD